MLKTASKVLFLATSVVPHFVVYGCAIWPTNGTLGVRSLAVAVLLLVISLLLVGLVRRKGQRHRLVIQRSESLDREGFAFLLTYALPLLAARDPEFVFPGLVTFLAFLLLFLARSEMLWVNPLLTILGFHALKVVSDSDNTYLLLTRSGRQLGKREVTAIRLTDIMWLEE